MFLFNFPQIKILLKSTLFNFIFNRTTFGDKAVPPRIFQPSVFESKTHNIEIFFFLIYDIDLNQFIYP